MPPRRHKMPAAFSAYAWLRPDIASYAAEPAAASPLIRYITLPAMPLRLRYYYAELRRLYAFEALPDAICSSTTTSFQSTHISNAQPYAADMPENTGATYVALLR